MSAGPSDSDLNLSVREPQPRLELIIPFGDAKEAEIAYNSLRVDREPKRSQVEKTLALRENQIVLNLVGPDARSLRLTSNTFFDHLILVQKTIERFSLDKYSLEEQPPKAKKPFLIKNIIA